MGERLGKTDTAERLLGLEQRLIDRLQALSVCKISTYPSGISVYVDIHWLESGLDSNSGNLKFFLAKEIDTSGFPRDFSPNILNSSFLVLGSPFHALSAVLTMMATINKTARVLEEDLSHVVKANKNSQPYFQRFQKAGLYNYCDPRGRIRREPVVSNELEYYACRYPVEGIDSVIGKFVVDEAVGEIIRMREERMKDFDPRPFWSDPRPFWSFVKNLVPE